MMEREIECDPIVLEEISLHSFFKNCHKKKTEKTKKIKDYNVA